MKKVSSTEAIRRGFSILGSVSRSPMSSRDIFRRLYDDGFNVSIRTIERDLSRLPDIFPSLIEVDDRSKPFTYRQPVNARKYSAMNPTEAICLELAFSFLNPILPKKTLPQLCEGTTLGSTHDANKIDTAQLAVLISLAKSIAEVIWPNRTLISTQFGCAFVFRRLVQAMAPFPKQCSLQQLVCWCCLLIISDW